MNETPTDAEIAEVVRERRGMPTYVIRNSLATRGWRQLTTPWVRRQLVRMTMDGKVERDEKAEYGQNHCWRIPDAAL